MLKYNGTVIFVKDMQASRRFYEDLLEQKPKLDMDGYVGYESSLYLWGEAYAYQAIFQLPSETITRGPARFEIFLDSDELEYHWQRLNAAGVKVIHPIMEMPWGQQVLRVYDPDGNIVEVGEPLEVFVGRFLKQGLSLEETSRRTFTPIEIVRQIADKP
jgi:predicted enzyme related to lactoylglutathione lyase